VGTGEEEIPREERGNFEITPSGERNYYRFEYEDP
jgi:hypothetical protein